MPKNRGKKRGRPKGSGIRPRTSSRSSTSNGSGRGNGTSSTRSSIPRSDTGARRVLSTPGNVSSQPHDQAQASTPATIQSSDSQASTQLPPQSIQLSPFELQQIYDQRNAHGSPSSPVTSPELAEVHISPTQLQNMNETQLHQLLAQISAQLPSTNHSANTQWSRPHLPTPQVSSQLPSSQAQLVRNSQATASANAFLQQTGIPQNLPNRAPELTSTRPQYPAPAFILAPPVPSTQQQILNLLQRSTPQATLRRHDKAIQLSDYISPTATFDEDRLMASPDGSIKMGKPSLKFFDVPTWGAMALTSAADFSKLHILKDPRIVKFNLWEYLFYLQNMFVKFKRYKFKQVLQFDRAYRTLQLREAFVWGTHIPELFQCHLSGHHKPEVTRKAGIIKKAWQQTSKTCHTFNRGLACTYNPCSYLHQCTRCGKGHPATNCPSALPKPNTTS